MCEWLNLARIQAMGNFDKLILNSSYNFEWYNKKILTRVHISAGMYHTPLTKENFKKLEYLEKFKTNPQKTFYELADLILFEIENFIQEAPKKFKEETTRKIVYEIVDTKKKQAYMTPLSIANTIQ